jgi:hypothetical protein
MAPTSWTASSHQPLETLVDGLWRVVADMSSPPFSRQMTLIRLSTGELVVHSAVACDAATMAHIDSLGRVAYIVVPNGFHRIDAPRYAARYPEAVVVAPPASIDRVRQVVPGVAGLDKLPRDAALVAEPLGGVPHESVLLHTDSRGAVTAIFTDAFFNLPEVSGWKGLALKAIGSGSGPRVTRIARWTIVKDKAAYAAHLRRIAAMPGLARIIPGHGDVVRDKAAATLEKVAATL